MRENTPLNAYRCAIYYAPDPHEPLAILGRQWLGRDPHDDASYPQPRVPGVSVSRLGGTGPAQARRYGLHATMKAPFRLAPGRDSTDLRRALREFTLIRRDVLIPRLALSDALGFPALVPASSCPPLDALAADCVRAFDVYRAALTPEEIERRMVEGLSTEQTDNLLHWGYPYVFKGFRFHITLADAIPDTEERATIMAALREHFAPVLDKPLCINSLCLFMEPEKGTPFRLFCRDPFG